MELTEIADLLTPFLGGVELKQQTLGDISIYIDILERWNQRTNLTAVRSPREIVTRHFGESLFAARQLLSVDSHDSVIDVGSGAGFPGLPLKLWARNVQLSLVESQNKKATFLKEVVRALGLQGVEVFAGRAESLGKKGDLVTMRAVDKFDRVLPVAASLVADGGRLGLLIGAGQLDGAKGVLPGKWSEPIAMPVGSGGVATGRIIAVWQK